MAKKKVAQEHCTFCEKQPCECATTKRDKNLCQQPAAEVAEIINATGA